MCSTDLSRDCLKHLLTHYVGEMHTFSMHPELRKIELVHVLPCQLVVSEKTRLQLTQRSQILEVGSCTLNAAARRRQEIMKENGSRSRIIYVVFPASDYIPHVCPLYRNDAEGARTTDCAEDALADWQQPVR